MRNTGRVALAVNFIFEMMQDGDVVLYMHYYLEALSITWSDIKDLRSS